MKKILFIFGSLLLFACEYPFLGSAFAAGAPTLVSHASQFSTSNSSVQVAFPTSNNAGDLLVATVLTTNTSAAVSLSDTNGNHYTLARSNVYGGVLIDVFYAANVVAGTNTVTGTASGSTNTSVLISDFSGVSATNPIDVSAGSSGYGNNLSVTMTTSASGDLLYGIGYVANGQLNVGSGFAGVNGTLPGYSGDEYEVQSGSGSATVGFVNGSPSNGTWNMVAVAFEASGSGGGSNPPPGNPPIISSVQVSGVTSSGATIIWTTNTSSNSQVNYGTTVSYGSSSGLNTSLVTSHSIALSSLSPSTTYHYEVQLTDSSGNMSVSSDGTFTTTAAPVSDTQPPTTPTGLSAAAVSASQINLSWSPSTDNVGVAGYKIYRSSVQIATVAGTAYSDSALSPSTSYTYTVVAYDAAGNVSAQSSPASATTQAQPPTSSSSSYAIGWTDLPGTSLQSACPPNGFGPEVSDGQPYPFYAFCNYVINAWGDGITDTNNDTMVIWGGGHSDYAGNEIYQLDVNAKTMKRLDDPSLPAFDRNAGCGAITSLTYPYQSNPTAENNWAMPDGRPNSRHTQGQETFIPSINSMFTNDGGVACGNGPHYADTWLLNLGNITNTGKSGWTQMDPVNGIDYFNGTADGTGIGNWWAVNEYDPDDDTVISALNTGLLSYNYHTNTYTLLKGYGTTPIGVTENRTIDTKRNLMITWGADWPYGSEPNYSFHVHTISLAPPYAVTDITSEVMNPSSGCTPWLTAPTSSDLNSFDPWLFPGMAYDPVIDRTVLWPNTGNTVYLFNPDTDTCTSQTLPGMPPTASGMIEGNGTIGRFGYFPNLDVFALVSDPEQDAYILKINNSGLTSSDTTPPSIPTNLSATNVSSTAISIAWTPSTDNVGVLGYKIYRNGAQVGANGSANFTDTGLVANTNYSYTVVAYDAAGNVSAQSAALSVTTIAKVTDTIPPSTPTSLSASAVSSNQINLSWTASTDNVGVAGYYVYRGGVQIATSTANSYIDVGLSPSTNYIYTVSAYDAAGNVSVQSSATNATTQSILTAPTSSVGGSFSGLGYSSKTCVDLDGDGYGTGPLASLVTSASGAVTPGVHTVTLGATTGLVVGQRVRYDLGPGNMEFVTLTAVSGNTITGNFAKSHAAGITVSAGTKGDGSVFFPGYATDDPGCLGLDADDRDPTVQTAAQGISKYGSLNAFLAQLGQDWKSDETDTAADQLGGAGQAAAAGALLMNPAHIYYLAPATPSAGCIGTAAQCTGKHYPTNTCTNINSPCQTIADLLPAGYSNSGLGGDLILARDGWNNDGLQITLYSGAANRYNGLWSYPGEHAVVTTAIKLGAPNSCSGSSMTQTNYIWVDGMRLEGTTTQFGGAIVGGSCDNTSGQNHDIVITHNNGTESDSGGLAPLTGFNHIDNWTIEYNTFHDDNCSSGCNTPHGIYMGGHQGGASSDTTIRRNLIFRNSYNGLHWNGPASGFYVDQNVVYDNGVSGLDFDEGFAHSFVRANTVFNNSKDITFDDYPGNCPTQVGYAGPPLYVCPGDINYNLIENNTIYHSGSSNISNPGANPDAGCPVGVNYCQKWAINFVNSTNPLVGDMGHNTLRNNILVSYGNNNAVIATPIIWYEPSGNNAICDATCQGWVSTSVFDHNLFWQSDGKGGNNILALPPNDYTCATAGSVLGGNTNCTDADPKFVAASPLMGNIESEFNFQLQASSPAIAAGTLTGAPTYDIAGNTFNNPPSIGAYEYNSQGVVAPPPPSDTTPPSVPTNLSASPLSASSISLSWSASTDNVGVVGYHIYRNGTLAGNALVPSYTDTGLMPSTSYSYTVSAYDAAGNASSPSTAASLTTPALFPSISNLLGSNTTASSTVISWNTNVPTNGQVSYGTTVAYGFTSLLVDNNPKALSHTVPLSTLMPTTLYHFKVTSMDASGNTTSSPDFTFTTLAESSAPVSTSSPAGSSTPTSAGTGGTTPPNPISPVTVYIPPAPTSTASALSIAGTTSPSEPAPSSPHLLTVTLIPGIQGYTNQVTALQDFLQSESYLPSIPDPGVYDNATESGVEAFQCAEHIVCSGTPATTGYGQVGPKTRTTINSLSGAGSGSSLSTASLTDAQLEALIQQLTAELLQLEAELARVKAGSSIPTQVPASSGSGASLPTPSLSLGSEGASVTNLQNLLVLDGYLFSGVFTPGTFDAATEHAVETLQCLEQIACSPITPGYGTVGPKTRAALGE